MPRRWRSGERRYETRSWVDCTDLFHQLIERPSTRAQQLLECGRDQALSGGGLAVRAQDAGGGGAPQRRRGQLRGDPLARVRDRHATAGEASELALRLTSDEPDLIAPAGVAGLNELDGFEDDCGRPESLGGVDRIFLEPSHGRVDDRLEFGEAVGVGEDEVAQGGAIQRAVGAPVLPAEAADYGVGDRRPGRHDAPRQLIGVDDGRATVGEPAGHGRLAATDRADEADQRRMDSQGAAARDAHGAASAISSQASSAATSPSLTVANSRVTRRSSTQLPCTAGSASDVSSSRLRSYRWASSSSIWALRRR